MKTALNCFRTFWSQQPVFGNCCDLKIPREHSAIPNMTRSLQPFPKMARWFPRITEPIFTVYYETGFQTESSLTFVAFWCRVSTACVPSTQFFSLKYFGSWGLNSNVPVAPLNGHFPWDIWVTGQALCSLTSGSRSPLRNENAVTKELAVFKAIFKNGHSTSRGA